MPQVGREGCRTRDAEPQRGELADPSRRSEPVVHRRHAEEHGAAAAPRPGPHRDRSGRTRPRTRRRRACRTARRKARGRGRAAGQDEPILGGPAPRRVQRRDARQKGRVGVDRALGLPSGARGIDDQRVVAARTSVGPACPRPRRPGADAQHGHAWSEDVTRIRPVVQGQHGIGVTDDMGHLGRTGRRAHGHEDGAGAQHGEEGLDGLEGGPGPPQDPVAGPDAARDEVGGHQRRAAVEVGPVGGPRRPHPSTSKGASGRAAHSPRHTSGSVCPGAAGPRGASAPAARALSPARPVIVWRS